MALYLPKFKYSSMPPCEENEKWMSKNSVSNAIAKIFTIVCLDFILSMFMQLLIQFNPTDGDCGLAACQELCQLFKSSPMASMNNCPNNIHIAYTLRVQSGEWLLGACVLNSTIGNTCKCPLAWQLEGKNMVRRVFLKDVSSLILVLRGSFEMHF